MHDLTAIQGDEHVGQRPYQPLPETKKKTKPASSESAGVLVRFNILFFHKKDFESSWVLKYGYSITLNLVDRIYF